MRSSLTHPPGYPQTLADGGAVLQQRHYHNFKQFRIFDLSDHKMTSQHLIVSWGLLGGAGSGVGARAAEGYNCHRAIPTCVI